MLDKICFDCLFVVFVSSDLCEDIEMKQRVLEIIEEVENNQPSKSRDNSINRRNSAARKYELYSTVGYV